MGVFFQQLPLTIKITLNIKPVQLPETQSDHSRDVIDKVVTSPSKLDAYNEVTGPNFLLFCLCHCNGMIY